MWERVPHQSNWVGENPGNDGDVGNERPIGSATKKDAKKKRLTLAEGPIKTQETEKGNFRLQQSA